MVNHNNHHRTQRTTQNISLRSQNALSTAHNLNNIELRLTWQSDATDLDMRSQMMEDLHKMLLQKREGGVTLLETMPQRIQRQVPALLRKVESLLYLTAPTKDVYLDKSTLKDRLRGLMMKETEYSRVESE